MSAYHNLTYTQAELIKYDLADKFPQFKFTRAATTIIMWEGDQIAMTIPIEFGFVGKDPYFVDGEKIILMQRFGVQDAVDYLVEKIKSSQFFF